jgi:hypothetical protein
MAAKFGFNAPTEILIEIEDLCEEISILEEQLAAAK